MNRSLLDRAIELGARESGLAVVATSRADGSTQASVVNAGVLDHPLTDEHVVGFVARAGASKLANLRARPKVTIVFRSGWEWVTIEGDAHLAGPDDVLDGLDPSHVARLLRVVYAAAVGGTHNEWAALDPVISAQRQTAVLVRPARAYTNPRPGI